MLRVVESLQEVLKAATALQSLLHRHDAEPLLIVDRASSPRRLFIVHYVMGGGGEFSRPIFKNELTGYDCEMLLVYPTQTTGLDKLQALMESYTFGSGEAPVSRILVTDLASGNGVTIKTVISNGLIHELSHLYEYAW